MSAKASTSTKTGTNKLRKRPKFALAETNSKWAVQFYKSAERQKKMRFHDQRGVKARPIEALRQPAKFVRFLTDGKWDLYLYSKDPAKNPNVRIAPLIWKVDLNEAPLGGVEAFEIKARPKATAAAATASSSTAADKGKGKDKGTISAEDIEDMKELVKEFNDYDQNDTKAVTPVNLGDADVLKLLRRAAESGRFPIELSTIKQQEKKWHAMWDGADEEDDADDIQVAEV